MFLLVVHAMITELRQEQRALKRVLMRGKSGAVARNAERHRHVSLGERRDTHHPLESLRDARSP